MTSRYRSRLLAPLAAVGSASLCAAGLFLAPAAPALADTSPPAGMPATVSADALPTVQINGVVWAQVTVGNTVYATGSFTKARPAGSAAGVNESTRSNLVAFNLTTGVMTTFSHALNAQGRSIAASPDGSTVYVGGDFTTVDGTARNHVAAFNVATGALVTTFNPNANSTVRAISATNTAVYLGGDFSTVAGSTRSHLAEVAASTGALQSWSAATNDKVFALALSGDGTRLVVGGAFTTLNGATYTGLGAVSPTTGANTAWSTANNPINDTGSNSWITSLAADGTQVYGTGYYYTSGGNFEGRFAVNPNTGDINFMNSCHGDSYSVYPVGQVIYSAGHEHDCSDIGDFTQDDTMVFNATHHFGAAETTFTTGTLRTPAFSCCPRYFSFPGMPHSAQLDWYPTFTEGSASGQSQAAWSVTGNASYVSYGGEFPTVNGGAQQGLVRFAIRSLATNKVGPVSSSALTPTAVSQKSGTLRVSWRATSDQDNESLTYRLFRDGGTTAIDTVTQNSRFWYTPEMQFVDSGLTAGSSHTYRVTATDPLGNVRTSGTSTAATVGSASLSAYATRVVGDGATNFWPLSETSGTTGRDYAGGNDLTYGTGVTHGTAGPTFPGNASTTFDGTTNALAGTVGNAPQETPVSVEAWVKTTSTAGGEIAGYGVYQAKDSQISDRVLYIGTDGKVYWGVYANLANTAISSTAAINNGAWHHVVGTLSTTAGMKLYVDGVQVAANASATGASQLAGYWRIGGDSLAGWVNAPVNMGGGPFGPPTGPAGHLSAAVADVATYPSALSLAQVQSHEGGAAVNNPPTAAFTSSCTGLTCSFDGTGSTDTDGTIASYAWTFGDGGESTSATPSRTYAVGQTYTVALTVTDNSGATNTVTHTVSPTTGVATAIASDTFNRTLSGSWGSADTGGAWAVSGTAANLSVAPGTGSIAMPTAGGTTSVSLSSVSAQDINLTTTAALSKVPTGSGAYLYVIGRRTASTEQYRAYVRVDSAGAVSVALLKRDGASSDTVIGSVTAVSGLTYTAGTKLDIRFQAVGTSPTTLRIKVWKDGTTEPTAWTATATDSTAGLQVAGGVGLSAYLSSSATNAPMAATFTAFGVTAP